MTIFEKRWAVREFKKGRSFYGCACLINDRRHRSSEVRMIHGFDCENAIRDFMNGKFKLQAKERK